MGIDIQPTAERSFLPSVILPISQSTTCRISSRTLFAVVEDEHDALESRDPMV